MQFATGLHCARARLTQDSLGGDHLLTMKMHDVAHDDGHRLFRIKGLGDEDEVMERVMDWTTTTAE